MIWNREYETMPRNKIKEIQLEKLKYIVNYTYNNVRAYRDKLDKAGVKPEMIKTLDDIKILPFMDKTDFRDNYPFGLFAVGMDKIVRIHSSSGTTGKPTVVGYTRNDMKLWTELVSRLAMAGGVTPESVVQVAFGYGLFTGGFGLHQGCENIGATIIPASSGNTQRQIMLMQDFGTTVLICTPSYALYIGEMIKEMGLKDSLKLRYGLFGGEPWSERTRQEIESLLGIDATDNYGLSEIIGPGFSGECLYKDGLHIQEDHFIVEIINPKTGEVLPDGEEGELVITTLSKEALPVIRYRTHDITSINPQPCKCGRTTARMKKTLGRTDDMIIIRGVNVFPSQIEETLFEVEGISPHYQIIVDRVNNLDTMKILVEITENLFVDEMKRLHIIEEELKDKIETILGIKVDLKLVEPKTLERFIGKAKRVIDNRKI